MLLCAQQKQDTLAQIQASYFLSETYRIVYERDSLFYYHNLAHSLAQVALPPTDSLALRCRHRAGILALLQEDYEQAKSHFDAVDSLYQSGSWRAFIFEVDQLQAYGNYYEELEDLEKAHYYFSQGLERCEAHGQAIAEERLSAFYSNLAAVVEKQGDILTALQYNQRSLDLFFKHHSNTHPEALIVYNNLGGDYLGVGNYEKGASYLEGAYEALRLSGRSERSPTDIILNNLGYAYYECGDIDKAILSYQKAIAIRKETYGEGHLRTLLSQLHLSSMYVERDEPELSIQLLEACKTALEEQGESGAFLLAVCHNNLAISYRDTKAYDEALANYQAALALYKARKTSTTANQAQAHQNLARTWIEKGDYLKALQSTAQAIELFESTNGPDASETIYAKGALGEPLYLLKQYGKARAQYEEAFTQWGIDSNTADFSKLEDKVSTLKLLASAVECYWAIYQDTKDIADLEQLLVYGKIAVRLLDHQRNRLGAEQTKTLLTDQYYQLYERIIHANLILGENDRRAIQEARAYANAARANTLQDAIRQAGATQFAGVPQDLVIRRRELRVNISFLEKQLQSIASDEAGEIHKQLFNLQREQEQLEQQTAQDYPSYYELLRSKVSLSGEELGQALPAETAMIHYFLGDGLIAAFITHPNGSHTTWAPLPEGFDETVKDFLVALSTPPANETPDSRSFQSIAETLYTQVFAPVAKYLPSNTKHLVIIPDGLLSYLPFELLCSSDSKGTPSFFNLPYLLSSYSFTYAPSSFVWQQLRQKQNTGDRAIIMAPQFQKVEIGDDVFANSRVTNLGPLYFNQEEAEHIGNILASRPLFGSTATLDAFLHASQEARFLHFATHAKINEANPRYSYLAFSGADEQQDSNRLFLADIYNLKLAADMVVLSACETGVGKLKRGEGMLSLARGFAYAGAKSIVPSLWAVNDQSTADIMTAFYQYLDSGLNKAEALRAAKLDYLQSQTSERTAHPYYWAPFIVIGDGGPIDFSTAGSTAWWWYAGGGVLVLLVFIWRRKGA